MFLPLLALFLIGCGGSNQAPVEVVDPTSPKSLRALIPNLAADTDFDLSGDLRWGFVFADPRKEPLVKLSAELTKLGYEEVELSQTIKEAAEWRLHSEKIQRLDADQLVIEAVKLRKLTTLCHVLKFIDVKVSPVADGKRENQYQQGWWTYYSDFESEPCAISLNLALREGAPYLDFPSLIVTGIDFPKADSTSIEEQLKKIHELRAKRITNLKLFTHAIEAGALISGGQETHCIYVHDTTGVQELLREYYASNYPGYKHRIEIRGNIGWDVYLRELFPNTAIINEYEDELKELNLWQWVEDAR